MAVTGIILFGFVLVHMLGNLQVFLGPDGYNAYAKFLKGTPELLWAARATLLSSVILHIASGIRLAILNRRARPLDYQKKAYTRASWTSRAMLVSGSVVLGFILFHLAHFTLGLTDPTHYELVDPKGRHDVYAMFIWGFKNPIVSWGYVIAMVLLGLHLEHGVSSMFQTLGVGHPRYRALLDKIGPAFAILVVLGNISMPIAVQMGWLTFASGGA